MTDALPLPADPSQTPLLIALAIVLVGIAAATWWQLVLRVRRYGGGWLAAGALGVAILGLLVAIAPTSLSSEVGIVLLILALAAIYRPDLVVKATGGPSLRYRALQEGRELQLIVRERGGWSVAGRNEEVAARVAGLGAVEGPGTERYIELVRSTIFSDPEAPEVAARIAEREAAEAELRASLKGRPMFERELDRRAAALEPAAGPEPEAPEPETREPERPG